MPFFVSCVTKLRHEVANSRTGICLMRPLTATADICKRHWELYELEEDDPMLGSSVEIYQAMFSSFQTSGKHDRWSK